MNSPAATIEQFRATRRHVLDLSTDPMVGNFASDQPGYVYADGFFIEQEPDGSFYLPLVQSEYRAAADDLAQLEVLLFAYCADHKEVDAESLHLACVRENQACHTSCPCCGGAS